VAPRAPVPITRILLASSSSLDRAVLEANLLKAGYKVALASTVDEAKAAASLYEVDVVVADVGLSGGGGFSLCRKLLNDGVRLPAVGMSGRPVDPEVRGIGLQCGMETFIEAPFSLGQLRAAIELVLTRDRLRNSRDRGHIVSGGLGAWTVADLIRYMDFYGWTGKLSMSRADGHGTLHFRDGTLTNAALGELNGERAVLTMLSWNEGLFTLTHEPADGPVGPTVRPPRNIHRGIEDMLLDALGTSAEMARDLVLLPGLAVEHTMDSDRAREIADEELVSRLDAVLDGSRTLREALHAAQVEDKAELEQIFAMVNDGALHPIGQVGGRAPVLQLAAAGKPAPRSRTVHPAPKQTSASRSRPPVEAVPAIEPEPEEAERDQGTGIEVHGRTVSRKLSFSQKSKTVDPQPDTFAELEPGGHGDRRGRATMMTWLSVAAIVAVVIIAWVALRDNTSEIPEVKVLDDAVETATGDSG